MNEELQKQLAEYLKAIATAAEKSAGFVLEQAPLVVQEKIAFGRAAETVGLLLCVAALYACYRAVRWAFHEDPFDADTPGPMLVGVFGAIGCGAFLIGAVTQVEAVIKVWVAPRLYIVEWVMGMAKWRSS